ncbi:hypothetical protein DPMN_095422 [Dreissena polymorpha]|uniref:Uncharacterized protein n=1 Tax=Dreissena polymorpha TaxID=45954 RepID=A0A9D4R2Q6_DREPO|nr:hypothetical protein DPMN_095422 [Dreissena polymorpha]
MQYLFNPLEYLHENEWLNGPMVEWIVTSEKGSSKLGRKFVRTFVNELLCMDIQQTGIDEGVVRQLDNFIFCSVKKCFSTHSHFHPTFKQFKELQ